VGKSIADLPVHVKGEGKKKRWARHRKKW